MGIKLWVFVLLVVLSFSQESTEAEKDISNVPKAENTQKDQKIQKVSMPSEQNSNKVQQVQKKVGEENVPVTEPVSQPLLAQKPKEVTEQKKVSEGTEKPTQQPKQNQVIQQNIVDQKSEKQLTKQKQKVNESPKKSAQQEKKLKKDSAEPNQQVQQKKIVQEKKASKSPEEPAQQEKKVTEGSEKPKQQKQEKKQIKQQTEQKEQQIQPPKSNAPEVPQNPEQKTNAHMPEPLPQQKPTQTLKPPTSNPTFYCGKQAYLRRSVKKTQGRMELVSTLYDFDMYVDSKDHSVSNFIANTGTWEPHFINLIGHIVKPGDNVLNLGSQSGLEALVMGKIIGPKGKLFIFEPYTFSHSLVTKNIQINGLNNITTIYKVGASDEKSTGVIKIFYSNTGGSQINTQIKQIHPTVSQIPSVIGQTQNVQTDLVDSLLPSDVKLDFALIDVEKMQVKALRGMKKIIERSPNLVIMTQWQYASNRYANKKDTAELLNFFIEKGYKIYMYTGGDIMKCTVGTFYEMKDVNQLYRLNLVDLFFFPKTVALPK